jgi:ubiquinone/menaquinone biosynthesis C-methylase UbiE
MRQDSLNRSIILRSRVVRNFLNPALLSWPRGADILEYGCAKGRLELYARLGAKSITAIDISDVAINEAGLEARAQNLTNAKFLVMNAEEMTFADRSFDLVFGSGIIHHLDIEKSMAEIRRILRPNGRAIFWEPLGHNPLINVYRKLTPTARTVDEHPLLRSDFETMQGKFKSVLVTRYGLFSLLAVPFRRSAVGSILCDTLNRFDDLLLSTRLFKWSCWYVCIELQA